MGFKKDIFFNQTEIAPKRARTSNLRFRSTLTLEREACRKGCLQPEL